MCGCMCGCMCGSMCGYRWATEWLHVEYLLIPAFQNDQSDLS